MNITTKTTVTLTIELKDLEELMALQKICWVFSNHCTNRSDTENKVSTQITHSIQNAIR